MICNDMFKYVLKYIYYITIKCIFNDYDLLLIYSLSCTSCALPVVPFDQSPRYLLVDDSCLVDNSYPAGIDQEDKV